MPRLAYPSANQFFCTGECNASTRATLASGFDSNYVLGTSGDCFGFKWVSPTTSTVTDAYFFITTAPAEGRNLTCDICAENTSYPLRPNTTPLTGGSKDTSGGATANKWIKFTFASPPSVTAGSVYWAVFGDKAYSTTAYTPLTVGGCYVPATFYNAYGYQTMFTGVTSTAGFSANGTNLGFGCPVIIKYADGTVIGSPFTETAAAFFDNNQREHGVHIPSVAEDVYLIGILVVGASLNNAYSVRVYEGTTGPVGTIYSGFNGGASLTCTSSGAYQSFTPTLLHKGRAYRVVIDSTSNQRYPNCSQCVDGATLGTDFDLYKTCVGHMYACQDLADAWVDYNNATYGYYQAGMSLILADIGNLRNVARASSLGGSLDL